MPPAPTASATSAAPAGDPPAVLVHTLGCARNEVDSEELAGRLAASGFRLVDDPDEAAAVVVNTCAFVEAAKLDSVDAVLSLAGPGRTVVAVGCLAERYGATLAAELSEAAAVLSFDDYPDVADRVRDALAGRSHVAHVPRDRRTLLPLVPAARPAAPVVQPGHLPPHLLASWAASGAARRRLSSGPVAPLKLASGCDRRCSFCAIPAFRGSFVSRPPADVLAEARWLAAQGVRELFLVSENTTSYGKDLGDLRLLERLLPELAAVAGIARVRVSYLQPAELRPGLLAALTSTPGVAPYLDLSFQHASEPVLRRMRRFGSRERFLDLLAQVRDGCPTAGVRSNVIVGFPGEDAGDLAELEAFLGTARLDAVGVFGYSPEDGTEAATLPGALDPDEVAARASRVAGLVDELMAQRAEERVGERVDVLVERVVVEPARPGGDRRPERGAHRWVAEGRAAHQGPDTDGTTSVGGAGPAPAVGDLLAAVVEGSVGVDLRAVQLVPPAPHGVVPTGGGARAVVPA